ncbi:P5-type ATPase cation transporter-domain-containing protein [Parasitella parasitica]|nr:P5-type ATPase cation transporter-domain-containing protein [Parasitella parasitica]
MSTHPATKTRSMYGASSVDSRNGNSARRDSAAPLINTPPIQPVTGIDPLEATGTSYRSSNIITLGSYARHGGHRTGLFRRRRNSTSSVEDSDEEDSDRELNTSDEESSADDDDDDEDDDEDDDGDDDGDEPSDGDDDTIQHVVASRNNTETRISGLNAIANDTKDGQTLLLEDEDVQIHIQAYKFNRLNLFAYRLLSVLSLGIFWLICRWVPKWYIAWTGIKVPLEKAEWIVFKSQYNEIEIIRPFREWYQGTIGTIFSLDQIKQELHALNVSTEEARQLLNMDDPINQLMLVEYRYIRLAYHPRLHKFLIVGRIMSTLTHFCRFWKDQSWNSTRNFKLGLTTEKHHARLSVFGPNLINIREKPTSKLLTDEVLNPFYVFQIGSILLWCMDDYYYYAFCIFIISAFSIISTLIETKQVILACKVHDNGN